MRKHSVALLAAILVIAMLFIVSGCNPSSPGGLSVDYNEPLGQNQDRTLRTVGTWTKTGIVNHWHGGTDAGPMIMYGVEGLLQHVRTTNTYYWQLAESIEHNDDSTSLIHLRQNAKWHDGTPFTAKDVIAYYAIDYQNDVCKYYTQLEEVDEHTVKVYWKTYREPTDEAKTALFSCDTKLGSVQYDEFKTYVDQALEVIYSLELVDATDLEEDYGTNIVQPFGRKWNSSASAQMGEILNGMRSYEPDWFVATGPYKLDRYTETEMILVKNEDYYLDNSQAFDKIYVYQTPNNVNLIYSMLANNDIDYFDGAPLAETIEDILAENPNMVHYKMIDQNSCGLIFNLEKEIWQNDKVREAFQYIFDRDAIKNMAQPYGATSWYSMLTMTKSQAEILMFPEDFAKLKQYSYNQEKAAQLLQEAGWSRRGGKWYDQNGRRVDLTLGVENNTLMVNMGQVVQSTLDLFGITTTIKIGENWNTWFSTGRQENSIYDFVVGVTDANSYFTHPYGFMRHFFDVLDAHMLHLPTSDVTGRWQLTLTRPDGMGTVDLMDEIDKLLMIEGDELAEAVGNIVYGFSQYNFGVQFFENVTGSFFNASRVWGLPAVNELCAETRNITYIPQVGDEYFDEFADLNSWYTQGSVLARGLLYPRA